jgi:integrase
MVTRRSAEDTTTARLGELMAVQLGDLDLVNRFVEVQRNLVSGRVTTPKNHNRRRVDLSGQLTTALEARLVDVKGAARGRRAVPVSVFTNRDREPRTAITCGGACLRRR